MVDVVRDLKTIVPRQCVREGGSRDCIMVQRKFMSKERLSAVQCNRRRGSRFHCLSSLVKQWIKKRVDLKRKRTKEIFMEWRDYAGCNMKKQSGAGAPIL